MLRNAKMKMVLAWSYAHIHYAEVLNDMITFSLFHRIPMDLLWGKLDLFTLQLVFHLLQKIKKCIVETL